MTTQTVPIITLRMLRGACKGQRAIFKSEWPTGAEVTLENVLRAVELGLNLPWGTRWFTAEALDEYNRQEAPIWAEYERQHILIRAEHQRQHVPIWTEYNRNVAPIWLAAFLASHGGVE